MKKRYIVLNRIMNIDDNHVDNSDLHIVAAHWGNSLLVIEEVGNKKQLVLVPDLFPVLNMVRHYEDNKIVL